MKNIQLHVGADTYGEDELLPVPLVAKVLGISVRTARDMASRRELPIHKIGKCVRVRVGDLMDWMSERRTA
ncbi:helix-turn-helix domain-containing protein [Arhodomonas aquaeolei]|uniref:helix-turn-helix domain-containing protein n=1 Tax=Arhodomonas aquaeolei TaxID=2369 RepID=UPI00216796A9|nr:helix-turn-helix domain-containing protein [Arhodomonas aquaeolei]MCS4504302.1 helix-turn-helix domain-containing protein [Arhodomonas aquaeolei]